LHAGLSLPALLVPERVIRSLAELVENDVPLLAELLQITRELVERFDFERRGYRLIANGGK
jgi:hypothetical protein